MKHTQLQALILAGFFAAIIGILSQFTITIPFSLVPLTLQTFAIGLAVTILGMRAGTYAVLTYLLMGAIGIPVFAGASSGFAVIFGPTGGYLVGFLFNALVTGRIIEKTRFNYLWAVIANLAGALVTLAFGAIWLKIAGGLTWQTAFASGFLTFIIPGIIKAAAASYLGVLIGRRLPFTSKLYAI